MHVGSGSPIMAEQAASNTVGVVWVQEACNTVLPSAGGTIAAFSFLFFAFSTTVAYYYEDESGLAYTLHLSGFGESWGFSNERSFEKVGDLVC